MDQAALYRCLRDAGHDVLMFEDHPQFFGNWRAQFKGPHDRYEVVCDHREGWMTLWRAVDDTRNEQLQEANVTHLGDAAVLQTLSAWMAQRPVAPDAAGGR